jgi:hypothetical protein
LYLQISTACPGDPALGKTIVVDFTAGANSEFTAEAGTTINYGSAGAEFTIGSTGAARTMISTHYIFFGRVETWMKSAPGQGIVSSFVLESDDLDEIDWVCAATIDRVFRVDRQSGVARWQG